LTAAAIAGTTLLVFLGTLRSDFVYDARMQILTDPFLHDPRNWWDVISFRVLARDVLDFNRPVHLASLMLDAAVWGRQPFGYHLTSVLLHAGNAVLAWLVIRALLATSGPAPLRPGRRQFAAAFGALVFALHPLVTEAVCEPTFREDLLVAGFTLAAILIAQGRPPGSPGLDPGRAAACVAACLLAIGSKESGIAAPALVAAWWWLFRRTDSGSFWGVAICGAKLVVIAFLSARFLLETSPSAIFESKPVPLGGSIATAMLIQPRILALYAQQVLLPVNLSADYGGASIAHLPLGLAVAILAAIAVAAGIAIRRDRRAAFAAATIALPLLSVCNLVPIYNPAADRYLYLPMAGVGMAAACLFDALRAGSGTRKSRPDSGMVAAAILLATLAVACVLRQQVWSGSLPLWRDTAAKNPGSSTAAAGLAEALLEAGRPAEAEPWIRRAIALEGHASGDRIVTLALVLDGQGRTAEACAAAERALETDPRLANPSTRVVAITMERPVAEAFADLLRHAGLSASDAPEPDGDQATRHQ
jgi:tetratricopeptide (TPR) repeat protein